MKKNFLQDVIPASQKRSIRDIPLPSHQKAKVIALKKSTPVRTYHEEGEVLTHNVTPSPNSISDFKKEDHSVFEPDQLQYSDQENSSFDPKFESSSEESTSQTFTPHQQRIPTYKKTKKSIMKKITIGLLIGVIVFTGFIFSRTEAFITVQSKKSTQEIDSTILLDSKNPQVTKTQITKSLTKTLLATSEQQVEKQASGRIRITNTHKETPQELVKNTRFQTPSGLIYRIKDSIIIPGYTMSGSNIVPGTLEIEVYADSAGEEYNISKTKFTIPGFAGREQFEKITAETVADITGGYIGIRKVVSENEKERAQKELEAELKTQIEMTQNQSTEYILVPDSETLTYGEIQDKAEGESVILTLSASVDAYSFVKKDLYNYIGQASVPDTTSADQFTLNGDSLVFSIDDKSIKINGSATVTWITDVEKLKNDFAGKKRSDITSIMESYRSFEKADAKLSPFWKTRFPSDSSKIEVILQ